MGAGLEFRILGPLEVLENGERVPMRGRLQQRLLAALLVGANEVVSAERLVDVAWSGQPPASGKAALRVRISQLRKLLPDRLSARGPGYALRVEPGELDASRFERLAERGRAALAQGELERAQSLLQSALSLWHGPALDGLDSDPHLAAEKNRLEELRLLATEARIEAQMALGRHADLIAELEALVAQDPLHESFRRQLMLALYRSGRQADALETYRDATMALDELGLRPSAQLRRMERLILSQDPELDSSAGPTRA